MASIQEEPEDEHESPAEEGDEHNVEAPLGEAGASDAEARPEKRRRRCLVLSSSSPSAVGTTTAAKKAKAKAKAKGKATAAPKAPKAPGIPRSVKPKAASVPNRGTRPLAPRSDALAEAKAGPPVNAAGGATGTPAAAPPVSADGEPGGAMHQATLTTHRNMHTQIDNV